LVDENLVFSDDASVKNSHTSEREISSAGTLKNTSFSHPTSVVPSRISQSQAIAVPSEHCKVTELALEIPESQVNIVPSRSVTDDSLKQNEKTPLCFCGIPSLR
jgi:hypothetical protein